jgi:hypothetical protein
MCVVVVDSEISSLSHALFAGEFFYNVSCASRFVVVSSVSLAAFSEILLYFYFHHHHPFESVEQKIYFKYFFVVDKA